MGPLIFLLYINYLPKVIDSKGTTVLFADATSALIMYPNTTKLQNDINIVFKQINIWFEANLLSLNFNKSQFIQFTNKSTPTTDICIKYYDKQISNTITTKFLGLTINDALFWKTHIKYIIPKLSSASNTMRSVKPYVSQTTLRIIYYTYFHSIMNYVLLFWGTFFR